MMTRNNALLLFAGAVAALVATSVMAAPVSISHHDNGVVTATPDMVKEFNVWINSFLFSEGVFEWTGEVMGPKAAHYFLTYVRNFLGGSMLYYITAGCWHW